MQQMNGFSGRRFRPLFGSLGAALLIPSLLAGPAHAGSTQSALPVTTLKLELGGPDRFVLLDAEGAEIAVQDLIDLKTETSRGKDGCVLALRPDPNRPPEDHNELVNLVAPGGRAGIDVNKGAIGDRENKGAGCGQLEQGDVLDIFFLGRSVVSSRIQLETKQNAAAEITFRLDGVVVGRRYLLSGTAAAPPDFPPMKSPDLLLCNVGAPDGNPDSFERDDCLLYLSRARGAIDGEPNPEPFHNQLSILVRNDGKISLKGGSEFPDPDANRSAWDVVEFDGILDCGDGFSCQGNEDCTSDGVSGNRTDVGTGDACAVPIPYELKFDGQEVTFRFVDTFDQQPAFALDVQWEVEATGRDPGGTPGAQFPPDPTILSYDPAGVACGPGSCTSASTPCQFNSDCAPGSTCVLPVTDSCIPLTLCVGSPIRRCSNDPTLTCREDADCGPGNTCRMDDLVAPAGGFPDLVSGSPTTEYGCVCEEDVLYLGPGLCDEASGTLAGASCGDDSDCLDAASTQGSCELFPDGDRIAVEQCLFFIGDPAFKRGR